MDAIQKTLIKAGRKDLAQKYYKKIIQSGFFSELDASLKEAMKKWKAKGIKKIKDGYEFTAKGIKSKLVFESGKVALYLKNKKVDTFKTEDFLKSY